MNWQALKYLTAYLLPLTVAISLTSEGWLSFLPLLYSFGFIPLLELAVGPQLSQLSPAQKALAKEDRLYDWLLYLMAPLMFIFIFWYGQAVQSLAFTDSTFWGRTLGLGLLCGVIGINVGHELGHRTTGWEQRLAKILLTSSLYTHFFIEHNYGHHRNVATPEDPATARYNETLYAFWWRSIVNSYRHAWQIQRKMLLGKKVRFFSLKNHMLLFHVGHLFLLLALVVTFGSFALAGYLIAALIGIVLLESVNYIEHYGLARKKVSAKRYENTTPVHSWNSNHLIGRLVLFELSRHSDHHANPHKKYQTLQSYLHSPQLPTGYPGMIILAFVPPLWFALMNRRIQGLHGHAQGEMA